MNTINDRYEIIKTIATDTNSVEYLVSDHIFGGMLKRMRVFDYELSNVDYVNRFKTWFIDLKSYVHSGLTNLYEFSPVYKLEGSTVSRKQYYYTYEHIPEAEVVHYLDLEKNEINQAIVALCKVMKYLHFRGYLYKYLGFEQITFLRTNQGIKVKLVDLAMTKIYDYQYRLSYDFNSDSIAPEVTWGEELDERADVYSLGTVIYYLYYQIDYQLKTIKRLIPTNPFHKCIIVATSAIHEERHATVKEFIHEISTLLWLNMDHSDAHYYNKIQENSSLIGREQLIEDIIDLIIKKSQKNDVAHALYLEGEVGSGKSRIIREVHYKCKYEKIDYLLLKPGKYSDPYYSLKSIIRHMINQEDIQLSHIQKYSGDLSAIVPEISTLHRSATSDIDISKDYLRLINRAYNLFVEYCANRFMVLIIDDEDYLSEIERLFFDQLIHHGTRAGYMIIFSGTNASDIVSKYGDMVEVRKFSSLGIQEISALASATLGVRDIPLQFVHRLFMESQGAPSLAKKLIHSYYDRGVIYFDEKSYAWQYSDNDSDYKVENLYKRDAVSAEVLNRLNKEEYNKLRVLSVLRSSFNMKTMFEMADMTEEEGHLFIRFAESNKLLNKRISDIEHVFSFVGKDVQEALYMTLDSQEVKKYNAKAAVIYEKEYLETGIKNDLLIDYLAIAGDQEKLVTYSMKFAEDHLQKGSHFAAIELYDKAKEALKQMGDPRVQRLLLMMAEILMHVGRFDSALQRVEEVIASSTVVESLPARIIKIQLMMMKIQMQEAAGQIDFVLEASKTSENRSYYYYLIILKAKIYKYQSKQEQYTRLLEEHRLQAKKESDLGPYYLMDAYLSKHDDDYVLRLKNAIAYFEKTENVAYQIEMIMLLAMYYNYDKLEFYKSRELLRSTNRIAQKKLYYIHTPHYLIALGETFWLEGKFDAAVKCFKEAIPLVEKYGLKDLGIISLDCYCQSMIHTSDYGKANTLLSKLEHEVQVNQLRQRSVFDFKMMTIEYHLALNNLSKAKQLRYEINGNSIGNSYRMYWLKVIDAALTFKQDLLNNSLMDDLGLKQLRIIESLNAQVHNHREAKLLREHIAVVGIELIARNCIVGFERIREIDDRLKSYYNTRRMMIKRNLLDAFLSHYTISKVKEIATRAKDISDEFYWRTYYILGNLYLDNYNYYEALRSYLIAMDIIADINHTIPSDHKNTYILNDELKIAMRTKINRIIRKLMSKNFDAQSPLADSLIVSLEDFFDLTNLNGFYLTEEFKHLMMEHGKQSNITSFDSSIDFIKSFTTVETTNFSAILQFMLQLTFAERGFLYLMDEEDDVLEVISANPQDKPYDIIKLIHTLGNDVQGMYLSKLNSKTSVKLLIEQQKGFIFFPIFGIKNQPSHRRRKSDDLQVSLKSKPIAYVFLDSDNVINCFNEQTFQIAKSFSNLISVFIDNYHLKTNSTLDKLTGVYLRKYFEQQFTETLNVARMRTTPCSVLMMDIDKFKHVNDTYGHRKGDKILTKIGEILTRSVRASDMIGRYGGEEFIILLPETDSVFAYKVAETIRLNVQNEELLGEATSLTVSLGVATYPEDGVNEEELIERADKALYFSKDNGRNQTTSWEADLLKSGMRYDKLTGILTGQVSTDSRNIQAILKLISLLSTGATRYEVRREAFDTMIDIVHGEALSFYVLDEKGRVIDSAKKVRGKLELSAIDPPEWRLINKYVNSNQGEYYIDWDEVETGGQVDGSPDWQSVIIESFSEAAHRGVLIIKVPVSEKEFDFLDFNFVHSMRPLLEHIIFRED